MTRSLALVVLAVAAAVPLAPGAAFAGACARPEIPTAPLTADGTKLAKGGGVVVTMEDSAKPARWTFAGTSKAAAKVRVLGPGIAVYEPPGAGAWTLQDGKGKTVLKVADGGDAALLPAPKLTAIAYTSSTGRRGTSVWVSAAIAGDAPAGAVALLASDETGKPMSWGRISPRDPSVKNTQVTLYTSGSCSVVPNGTRGMSPGDKIKVAWIDASGRLSSTAETTVVNQSAPSGRIGP